MSAKLVNLDAAGTLTGAEGIYVESPLGVTPKRTTAGAIAALATGGAGGGVTEDFSTLVATSRDDLVRLFGPAVINGDVEIDVNEVLTYAYLGMVSGTVTIDNPTAYYIELSVNTSTNYPSPLGTQVLAGDGTFSFANTWPGAKQLKLYSIAGDVLTAVYENPLLVRSFWIPDGSDPDDVEFLTDRSYTYDQALATIALIALDDAEVETFVTGCLACVEVGGGVRFFLNRLSAESGTAYYRLGAAAWLFYALAFYLKKYPAGPQAAAVTAKLVTGLAWLETYKVVAGGDRRLGLYLGGNGQFVAGVFNGAYVAPWCATEHNVDIWFLFDLLGQLGFAGGYAAKATALSASIIDKLWYAAELRLRQGTDDVVDDDRATLDICSWGGLFLHNVDRQKALYARRFMAVFAYGTIEAQGYTAYHPEFGYPAYGRGVWTEGTMGAALLERALGNHASAANLITQANPFRVAGFGYRDGVEDPVNDDVGSLYAQTGNTAWVILTVKPEGFWNVDLPPLDIGRTAEPRGASSGTAPDPELLDRDNHVGTQAIATVEGLQALLDSGNAHSPANVKIRTAGFYISQARNVGAGSTAAILADTMYLTPFITDKALTIDQIGVSIGTGNAAAATKIAVYSSNAANAPSALVHETGAIDCSANGLKMEAWAYTFLPGVLYWIGTRTNQAGPLTFLLISSAAFPELNRTAAGGILSSIRVAKTEASAAADPFPAVALADLQNIVVPVVMMRTA